VLNLWVTAGEPRIEGWAAPGAQPPGGQPPKLSMMQGGPSTTYRAPILASAALAQR
jgi:hypothetical protein